MLEELKIIQSMVTATTPLAREMFYVFLGWKLIDTVMLWALLYLGGRGVGRIAKSLINKVED